LRDDEVLRINSDKEHSFCVWIIHFNEVYVKGVCCSVLGEARNLDHDRNL